LRHVCIFLAFAVAVGIGCVNVPKPSGETVDLSKGNYKVVKAGATGKSTGFVMLAIPFASPSYADAKADLYKNLGQNLEGRSIALINQTYDNGGPWLVVVAFPTITMTADVIEFTDEHPPTTAPPIAH
jgi:hypothetical protein